jgi:hypothetical protein
MIVFGDIATPLLALIALSALRVRWSEAIALVWVCLVVGLLETVNATIQPMRFSVFTHAWRELGDRDPLCACAVGEQRPDLHPAAEAGTVEHLAHL